MPMKRISVNLPDDLYFWIDECAAEELLSMSTFIRIRLRELYKMDNRSQMIETALGKGEKS